MKKLFSIVALLCSGLFLSAQQGQIQVPQAVNQAFKDGHPTHDFITWTMDGPNYKGASVNAQGLNCISVYDANGNLLRSESELAAGEVPVSIKTVMDQKGTKDYTVWKVEGKGGKSSYYTTVNSEVIRFDSEGKAAQN